MARRCSRRAILFGNGALPYDLGTRDDCRFFSQNLLGDCYRNSLTERIEDRTAGREVAADLGRLPGPGLNLLHEVDHHRPPVPRHAGQPGFRRSEEHTSELQSIMRTSYAVFCLKKTTR